MQKGIVVAGYIGVDVHKEIEGFPGPHDLVNIKSVGLSLGGLVSNCARDLALLDPQLPVYACGVVGDDGYGKEGGDFDEVTGKRCFFAAFPWRFVMGEGSGVRVLAITDPDQTFRFETGK